MDFVRFRIVHLFLAYCFILTGKAQNAGFNFTITGQAPAGFTACVDLAGKSWDSFLEISVPIKVNVFVFNMPDISAGGISLANGRRDFQNVPLPGTYYVTALANQIAGVELNPGESDMDIYINTANPYYFGTDDPPSNLQDFTSVMMHEIGHGLGFYSAGYVDGNGFGSFGSIPATAISPLSTTFPWVGDKGSPSIYDRYLVKASGNKLVGCAPDNTPDLGDSITGGPIYFSGPVFANASHGGERIRVSGGKNPFNLAVDLLHIHETYPNTIMSYYWGYGDVMRTPALWELGILHEIGWKLKPVGLTGYIDKDPGKFLWPNPVAESLTVDYNRVEELRIYSIAGELVLQIKNSELPAEGNLNIESLPEGIYLADLLLKEGRRTYIKLIVAR